MLKWTAVTLLAVVIALTVAIAVALRRAEPVLRAAILSTLEDRFHARVELAGFHVSLLGGLRAEGKGLRIWLPAGYLEDAGLSPGAPIEVRGSQRPLLAVDEFRFRAPLHYAPGMPIHIPVVQVRGLTIDVPPKERFLRSNTDLSGTGNRANATQGLIRFAVDNLDCEDARLILETSKPGKQPLEFAIPRLKLTGIQRDVSMHFTAELTNPRPVGTIHTAGTFGPWTVEDPGESAIQGEYRFDHANLGDFREIAGTLNSTGKYAGTLRDVTVDGSTDTPDFRITHFGSPMRLRTEFRAKVDATNGDTWLDAVNATLGESPFTAEGRIVRVADEGGRGEKNGQARLSRGRDIFLTVHVPRGRIEDFLKLASKDGTPLLTGVLTMNASLDIPPGNTPLTQRMSLKGWFSLQDARFTSAKVQDRMAELSLRGQGEPKQAKDTSGAAEVRAAMTSDFTMAGGTISFPNLKYTMPGADIDLAGTYSVEGGTLSFAGKARMQATVSQMLGGWKGVLAKPVDRFFKKDGAGTEVGIHIDGTAADPQFGINLERMKKSSPQRPGEIQQTPEDSAH